MRIFLLPISTRRTLLYCERIESSSKQTWTDRIINRTSKTWSQWERAEKGWQKTLTVWGNSVLNRIPFEEWGLKSLPTLSRTTQEQAGPTKVLYPSMFMQPASVATALRNMATERQSFHRRNLFWSSVIMPFTIPFTVVPM